MSALLKIDGLLDALEADESKTSDRYVRLFDGTKVPIVALGTWKSSTGEVGKAVSEAISIGYRHIDCAKAYSNEKEVGDAISNAIKKGTVKRDDLFIVSKLWNAHHEPKMVRPMLESTLKDLQISQLDVYLMHWPVSFEYPEKTIKPKDDPWSRDDQECQEICSTGKNVIDIVDTWKAMEECVKLGLTKYIGVSNFNLVQLAKILANCTIHPAMIQNESHLYCQAEKMVKFCQKNDIVFTGYSPLGSGDRPWASKTDPNVLNNSVATKIGKKYNKSSAQIVMRFQIQRGIVIPPKSTKVERLKENINLFDFSLTNEEMEQLKKEDKDWASCVPPFFPRLHPYWPMNEKCGALWD